MPRTIALFIAALSLGFAPAPFLKSGPRSTPADEWKALKGDWGLIGQNNKGEADQGGEGARTRVFTTGRMDLFSAGKLNTSWAISLDLSRTPKVMRFQKTALTTEYTTIYKVDGDIFTECSRCDLGGADVPGPPPKTFRPGQ